MSALVLLLPICFAPIQSPTPALHVERLESPAGAGSRCPRLATSPSGAVSLSWLESGDAASSNGAVLRFASLDGAKWSTPREIARGDRWFVNWADFPAMAVLENECVLAHFLEKSDAGTYDYHVRFTRSSDGGATWSTPERLHAHDGGGEHGFVSFARTSPTRATAVWLDGRNTKGGHGEGGGEMALYARTIDCAGALGEEIVVDPRVCDCCPTSAALLPSGAVLVAYRDRSADELRDVSVARIENGAVSSAHWESRDGWKVAGCPVNGPVLAASGDTVALAWFTFGADMRARVLCAFSKDGGRAFGPPIELAGARSHGRVDATFDDANRLIVTWLEADTKAAEWRVARVDVSGRVIDNHPVVESVSSRESGLGRVIFGNGGAVFAWTETGSSRRVAIGRLTWK
jgi:hypothetical protein